MLVNQKLPIFWSCWCERQHKGCTGNDLSNLIYDLDEVVISHKYHRTGTFNSSIQRATNSLRRIPVGSLTTGSVSAFLFYSFISVFRLVEMSKIPDSAGLLR